MVEEKFFRREHFEALIIESDVQKFHNKLINHKPKKIEKWVDDLKKNQKF